MQREMTESEKNEFSYLRSVYSLAWNVTKVAITMDTPISSEQWDALHEEERELVKSYTGKVSKEAIDLGCVLLRNASERLESVVKEKRRLQKIA